MQSALRPIAPATRAITLRSAIALALPALPWLITAAFIALGIMTSLKTPLYQGADEGWHEAYVEHYALGRPVPNLNLHFTSGDPSAPYWQTHEAAQPPLYYMLMGRLVSLVPRGDLMREQVLSGNAINGMYGNFLPADEGGLGTGQVLAGHLVRFATVLMGAAVVICSYYIALWPTRRRELALLTIALVAFNPRNLVLSSAISNDMAVACAAAVTLLIATYIVTADKAPRLLLVFAMGLCAGAALLTKYSGGAVLVAAPVALVCRMIRSRLSWRWLMLNGAVLAAGALVLTVPFFVHNWQLYGDILAWNRVNVLMPPDMASRPLQDYLNWLPFILTSFFAHPGYILPLPSLYTQVFLVVLLVGLAGSLWLALRRKLSIGFIPLLVGLLVNLLTYIPWVNQHRATENMRFFSPTLIPITLLVALGLLVFVPQRWRTGFVALGVVAYGLFTAVTLYQSLDVMYAFPHYLSDAEAQSVLSRPDTGRVHFENGIELLDVQLKNSRVDDGGSAELSITWRTTQPLTTSANLMLDFRDPDDQTVASLNTGNVVRYSYVPRAWQVGRPLREDYQVRVNPGKTEVLRILAGWTLNGAAIGGPIRPAGNSAVSVEIGRVKVRAGPATAAITSTVPPLARLDGLADLASYQVDGDALTLNWSATAQPSRNYTIFVHGLDAQGHIVAQHDEPFEYSAAYWDKGEQFAQRISVPNLSQARTIQVGVYDPDTGQRARALKPDGSEWAGASIVLR